jgi:CubicO group peptidase (beta-lactamase class C family)
VIGRLLEVVSGQPLEQFLQEQFLSPLGTRGTFLEPNPAIERRLPVMYSRDSDGKLSPTPSTKRTENLPTGTMVSTPADYMRFGQMLLNGGVLDGKRVLSRQSVAELLRNQLPPALTPITTPVWDHQGYGFGLGGGVLVKPTSTNSPASPGTYRWPGSTGTFFWVDPAADLVALVWTQSRPGYWLEHHFQKLVYQAVERPRQK